MMLGNFLFLDPKCYSNIINEKQGGNFFFPSLSSISVLTGKVQSNYVFAIKLYSNFPKPTQYVIVKKKNQQRVK